MRDPDSKYDYYAHEAEEYTLDSNSNVWDWAQNITSTTAGDGTTGISTIKRHAEYADQIMPFNITLIAQEQFKKAA